jgi:hypothetical protein
MNYQRALLQYNPLLKLSLGTRVNNCEINVSPPKPMPKSGILHMGIIIGGQVSRNRSGSIQITTSLYDTDSYFDYDYAWAWLNGPQGYTDNGLY